MKQISGVKTREDAIAAVAAIEPVSPVAVPAPPPADATDAVKANYAAAAAEVVRQNEFAARDAEQVSAVKALVTARLNSLPGDVKVVGLEVRADIGDLEAISVRIISHK